MHCYNPLCQTVVLPLEECDGRAFFCHQCGVPRADWLEEFAKGVYAFRLLTRASTGERQYERAIQLAWDTLKTYSSAALAQVMDRTDSGWGFERLDLEKLAKAAFQANRFDIPSDLLTV